MTAMLQTIGPSAYWYLTRSTGWVSLLLLTATMALGVLDVNRWSSEKWPRFALDSLHRTVSLLVLAFIGVHVLTAVLDSFAPIGVLDVLVPFVGSYRPIWLGLGAVALDLLLALAITSLLRQRVGHRAWRIVHWLAYACWPIALIHALGTGSDIKGGLSLALTTTCVLVVIAAVGVRALHGWPARRGVRAGGLALSLLAPLALIVWLASGPLGHGWAQRAGTPVSLLGVNAPAAASSTVATSGAGEGGGSGSSSLNGPFTASLSGTITEAPGATSGFVAVKVAASLGGSVAGRLEFEIEGPPVGEGGVSLRHSSVTLGSPPSPVVYHGTITALSGSRILARVRSASGKGLALQVALSVAPGARTVSGTVVATAL
ncbi:MAG: ferric reductase-like transmembrane domain-containing protein [Solirubrobacteraceae bacterium]